MKHLSKITFTAVAAAAFAFPSSAPAQPVTGHPYLDNVLPSAMYANWSSATFTPGPLGLEVTWAGGYGSGYFGIAAGHYKHSM
jgi:hypothetical protein